MDEKTILEAAELHFEALADRPDTIWPNQGNDGALPRLEFDQGPIIPADPAADSSSLTTFLLQATVVTETGSRSAENRDLAQQVVDHFRAGTEIGGAIVTKRPSRAAPYPDDNDWRQPITITLRARLAA